MALRLLASLLALAAPAAAQTDHAAIAERALARAILPGFERLVGAMQVLEAEAAAACSGAGPIEAGPVEAAYHRALNAWIGVEHFRFGPAEEDNARFAIAFWPDTKGATPRTIEAMVAAEDPGRRSRGLRRGLGRGARAVRARLPHVRPGGRADPGRRLSLPAAGRDQPRHGGHGRADAGPLARSLGRVSDERRGGGEPDLLYAGGVERGALLGVDRVAAGRRRPAPRPARSAPSSGRGRGAPRPGGRGARLRAWSGR